MNDAFICDGIRTPVGRYAGGLSGVRPDDLAALVIEALLARHPGLEPADIDEVVLGAANQAGEDNRNVARMAALLAGLPETVPGITVNRLCASGMDAVGHAARAIRAADYSLAIAGGVESMSRAPLVMPKAERAFARECRIYDTTLGWRFVNTRFETRFGIDSMAETADNVALEFGVSRADQDAFAARSQALWAAAHNAGIFADEIVPVTTNDARGDLLEISQDEHPRPETGPARLARLNGINAPDRSVTAGNASGVNDGAAALLIADRAAAMRNNLTPKARIRAIAAAGVAPRVMGIGPVPACRKVLAACNLEMDQIDVIELNEAFASQALASLRQLGIADDDPRVNPNGGAIAIGHPLGMSGARLVLTATRQLVRSNGHRALCAMCVGVGQGVAMILERV